MPGTMKSATTPAAMTMKARTSVIRRAMMSRGEIEIHVSDEVNAALGEGMRRG